MSGTSGNTNIDYSMGSSGGDFKIISKIGGASTDRLVLNSTGEFVFNGSINATSFIVGGANILTNISDSRDTSNILVGRINDTSNFVVSTSNILITKANLNDTNTSNYINYTSNILVGRIVDTSNYVNYTSNILINKANLNDTNTSNYVTSTSNILINKANLNDTNTSNYVVYASNILIDAIKKNKSSQWTTSNNNIYYNTYNVGIDTADPQTKLHIRDDATNITALTIQNNFTLRDITATPTATGTIGAYTTMIFTYTTGTTHTPYTINVPVGGIVCDILMVGGGGSGSHNHGGGGGGGAVVFINSVVLNSGSYTIKVGAGAAKGTRSTTNFGGLKGNDTIITLNSTDILKAEGGGGGGQGSAVGSIGNGGSGGGGDGYRDNLTVYNNGVIGTESIKDYNGTTGVLYGNNGGSYYLATSETYHRPDAGSGGGGGGAGQIGGNATKVNVAGNGGAGISSATINGNTYNFVDIFGTTYGTNDDNNNTTRYFGGGGGGVFGEILKV